MSLCGERIIVKIGQYLPKLGARTNW